MTWVGWGSNSKKGRGCHYQNWKTVDTVLTHTKRVCPVGLKYIHRSPDLLVSCLQMQLLQQGANWRNPQSRSDVCFPTLLGNSPIRSRHRLGTLTIQLSSDPSTWNSIRSHRIRVQTHQTAPSLHCGWQSQVLMVTRASDQLAINWGLHNVLLSFD